MRKSPEKIPFIPIEYNANLCHECCKLPLVKTVLFFWVPCAVYSTDCNDFSQLNEAMRTKEEE